jgi:hypothetical protein
MAWWATAARGSLRHPVALKTFALLAAILTLGPIAGPTAQSVPGLTGPSYHFSPWSVQPGGTIATWGSGFDPSTSRAALIGVDSTGHARLLGTIPVSAGSFGGTLTVPADLPPDNYFVVMTSLSGEPALNLDGPLTVISPGQAYFHFSPPNVLPGGAITVKGRGFQLSQRAAVVALIDDTGDTTMLGTVGLAGGGFNSTLTIPPDLAVGSYGVFVGDFSGTPVINSTGPLNISLGAVQPTVDVGFYPVGMVVNSLTNRVYAPVTAEDKLVVLDGDNQSVLATVPLGDSPCAIALNPETDRIYVANHRSNDVSVVNTLSN